MLLSSTTPKLVTMEILTLTAASETLTTVQTIRSLSPDGRSSPVVRIVSPMMVGSRWATESFIAFTVACSRASWAGTPPESALREKEHLAEAEQNERNENQPSRHKQTSCFAE